MSRTRTPRTRTRLVVGALAGGALVLAAPLAA